MMLAYPKETATATKK